MPAEPDVDRISDVARHRERRGAGERTFFAVVNPGLSDAPEPRRWLTERFGDALGSRLANEYGQGVLGQGAGGVPTPMGIAVGEQAAVPNLHEAWRRHVLHEAAKEFDRFERATPEASPRFPLRMSDPRA